MSRQPASPANVPYAPRRRGNRPDRALPDVPSGDDVIQTNIVEADQNYFSPPSPPPQNASLPPPPPPSFGAQTSAAHLHPFISELPSSAQRPPTILTPLRAHYLKKTLVNLQMSHELNLLTDPVLGANALGLLGDPFILPENAKREAMQRVSEIARQEGRLGDLPFMRFLFHQFLLPFPFLSTASPTFWSAKVQPFLSSFLLTTGYTRQSNLSEEEQMMAESLMTKEEKKESEERKKMWAKVEKHMGLMVGVGVKVLGGEEVVRIGQGELRRLEMAQEAKRKRWQERHAVGQQLPPPPGSAASTGSGNAPPPLQHMVFEVNVVGVRLVTEKGRVRHKSHEEFIIRTRRTGMPDVFVSRRYGDFSRLAEELRLAFPDSPIAPPPPKDRSTVASPVPQPASAGYSYYNPLRMIYGSGVPDGSSSPSSASVQGESSVPDSPTLPTPATPLSREKNRLTLRAYIQGILSFPYYLNSPILRSFLLSNPTTLTPPEAADCQRRMEADAVREEGRRRFRDEAERRVEALRQGLTKFKGDVLSKEGGLQKVFEVVRRVEKVQDLPEAEASVLEWGRISLAATIFQVFVASDTASETLASLKRLHGLMPYFVLKGILRISNPMAMIRGVLDLFLARPFGGQSLIQRMFSSSLTEDVRLIAEDIETVAEKIDDPVLCQKIEQFVMAPYEIQEIYRKDAASEGLDLLVVILRSPDAPILARPQFQRVFRAARAYKSYKAAQAELSDSDDDLGPENDDAWLFEDLNILLKLWLRKREKEQLLALIFEGVTAELLKDIITIFYAPLAQVYKAANIADSIGDLQNFLNDMIRTVEQVEELSQEDPQRTVQTFIDLVQRHEQAFYSFVHNVHSKGQGLFDSLMAWIELFLSYARDGIAQPIDLEFILPHGGEIRAQIMEEVDAVAQYHYKLKVTHEEKVRRRFNREGGTTDDEAALLDSVMASLSIGETTIGEAGEIADEESEEEEDPYTDEEAEEEAESRRSSVSTTPRTGGSEEKVNRYAPMPTPETLNPDLPPLGLHSDLPKSKKKDRRGSAASGSGRTSMEKIRSGFSRHSSDPKDKDKRPPPIKVDRSSMDEERRTSKRPDKKARARAARELRAPETPAINELRPLFVEALRPMLVVKPLKTLSEMK